MWWCEDLKEWAPCSSHEESCEMWDLPHCPLCIMLSSLSWVSRNRTSSHPINQGDFDERSWFIIYLFVLRMGGETAKCSTGGIYSEMKAVWEIYSHHWWGDWFISPMYEERRVWWEQTWKWRRYLRWFPLSFSHDISQNSQSMYIPCWWWWWWHPDDE